MPLGGALIGGLGALGSAAIGGIASGNATAAATAAREEALKQWLSVNVPDPAQQAIELQHYKVSGTLSPQLETAFQQSQTGLKNLSIDPASRDAEVQALTQMQNLASNGGMDAQSKQQEAQAINTANANEQGQRGAILQNYAARGTGGAGAELASMLQASQGDANQAAASGMSSAAAAQQRALQAMTNSSTMAGTVNTQDYNQAAQAAQAQDAINKFNTANSQTVANNNVSSLNEAQAKNLSNTQSVDNSNVDLENKQEIANKGLIQQNFNNQVTKATGSANAENGVANQANTNAGLDTKLWSNIGNSISQGAAAVGQYNNDSSKDDPNSTDSSDQ